jgi:uncharacterized protein
MSRMIFPNLAVKDLPKSVDFWTQLGFEFDARFTDETATAMVVSDAAVVMLIVEDRFKEFARKDVCDTSTHAETMLALSAEGRDEVDQIVDKALSIGATPTDTMDEGPMYSRGFEDLDGHAWSILYMDMSVFDQQ